MTQAKLEVRTPDGVVMCDTFSPNAPTPWRAAIMFPDAGGPRPAMDRIASRICDAGIFVFLPDLLYQARPFEPFDMKTVFSGDAERKRLMGVLAQVKPEETMRDVGLYLDALAKIDGVDATKIGAFGYCMGGMIAVRAAAAHPDRIKAVAAIHAGNLVTDKPDSPHLAASKIKARLYLGVADGDRSCTEEHQRALESALDSAGVKYRLELYERRAHGWAVDDFPVYDPTGAERHFERVIELLSAM